MSTILPPTGQPPRQSPPPPPPNPNPNPNPSPPSTNGGGTPDVPCSHVAEAGPSRPRAGPVAALHNVPSIDMTELSDSDDSPVPVLANSTSSDPSAARTPAIPSPAPSSGLSSQAPMNGSSANGSVQPCPNTARDPSGSAAASADQTQPDRPPPSQSTTPADDDDDFTITASTGPTRPQPPPLSSTRTFSRPMFNNNNTNNAIAGPSGGLSVNGYPPLALGQPGQSSGFSSYSTRPPFASQYGAVTPPLLPGQAPPPALAPQPQSGPRPGDSSQPIDVDNMPNPPPAPHPKKALCIGGFMGRAIMLYPSNAVIAGRVAPPDAREQYEVVNYRGAEMLRVKLKLRKAGSAPRPDEPWTAVMKDTIQVLTPGGYSYIGDLDGPVSKVLIDMLSRGLCRLEGFAMRLPAEGPQFEIRLNVLVFTLPSNIQYITNTLMANNTFLLDPMPTYEASRYAGEPVYVNAHGGHERAYRMYLNNQQRIHPSGYLNTERDKASILEVQRKQVDEVFKSIASGVELEQSDPGPWIKTNLFPHQRKALTFLLQGEQDWSSLKQARKNADKLLKNRSKREDTEEGSTPEDSAPRDISDFKSDTSRSLWEPEGTDDRGRCKGWKNKVTSEMSRGGKKPKDCRGAILADDMGLGKTLSVVSLIAATHRAAREWGEKKLDKVQTPEVEDKPIPVSSMTTKVFGMPTVDDEGYDGPKSKKRRRDDDKDMNDKAVQLARRAQIVKRSKATLLVCPMSTITNWEDQIKEHWNGRVEVVGGASPPVKHDLSAEPLDPDWDILRVYIYHGTSRKADPRFLAEFDIVITSYSTLANEYSKQCANAGDEMSTPATGTNSDDEDSSRGSASRAGAEDIKPADIVEALKSKKQRASRRKLGQGDQSPLQAIDWFRVVLDEAHSIKSSATVACKASCALEADRRIALTGTPIQNKIEDVWALFKFLRLTPIDNKDVFSKFITGPCKTGEQLGIARLQLVMRACCLRRTKETSDNGTKILNLPARKEGQVWLELREDERKIYNERRDAAQADIESLKATKQLTQNYAHVLQQLLRLRQTCDHVDLPKSGAAEEDFDGTIMDYEVAIKGIEQLGLNQPRAQSVICTQKDTPNGALCAECGVDFGPYFPSIGLGGVEDDAKPEPVELKKGKKDTRPILSKCMHILCLVCFRKSVFSKFPRGLDGVTRQCGVCESMLRLSRDVIEVVPPSDGSNEEIPKKTVARKKWERNPLEPPTYSRKMQYLADDLMPFSKRNPKSANFSPFYDLESGDGDVVELDDDGNPLITKSIVFSQWTTMLDRIEDMLRELQIKCCRLDGSMSREERARQIEQLRTDKATEVMLVSTRAGGVGLNLTCASRAYLVDPYWNPSVEAQAIDRIHRMGQKRPVTAIKLMIKDSVEEKLDEIQRKKADLAKLSLKNMSRSELMAQKADELVKLFSK